MRRATSIAGVLAVVMALASIVTALEAPHPDFSGTWVLESAGGDLPERAVKALAKGASQPITLVIVQSTEAFRVTRETDKGSVATTYLLNGSETTQATPHGEMKSRTQWEGASLVSTGSRPLPGPFPIGTRVVAFTETRTLSSDGQQMTIDIQFKTPRGVKTRTATFRRAG